MVEISENYEKLYKSMIEKQYGHEISQIIASLAAYQAGEITISDSAKEKFFQLGILEKDGKIKIKDPKNIIAWLEIATRLQIHYVNNNYRF